MGKRCVLLFASSLGAPALLASVASADEAPITMQCSTVDSAKASAVDELETGDVIEDGSASATVQPPGETVTADVLLVNGSETLTVGTEEDGDIFVEDCGPDEANTTIPPALNARRKGPFATISSPGECTDTAWNIAGYRWYWAYGWYFKEDTTPVGLSVANVTNALVDGTQSMTAVRNTCGMVDNVPAAGGPFAWAGG